MARLGFPSRPKGRAIGCSARPVQRIRRTEEHKAYCYNATSADLCDDHDKGTEWVIHMSDVLCFAVAVALLAACVAFLCYHSPGARKRRTHLRDQDARIAAAFRHLLDNPVD